MSIDQSAWIARARIPHLPEHHCVFYCIASIYKMKAYRDGDMDPIKIGEEDEKSVTRIDQLLEAVDI